jgi:hypothetical protein
MLGAHWPLPGARQSGQHLDYTKNYEPPKQLRTKRIVKLVLRHWPVTSLDSVTLCGLTVPIITDPVTTTPSGLGAWVSDDQRTMVLFNISWQWLQVAMLTSAAFPILQVKYSAGYDPTALDAGLQQACNQFCGEVAKSQAWIGYRSKVLAGESVTFDPGTNWGMSPRTLAMLQPYRDVIPIASVA